MKKPIPTNYLRICQADKIEENIRDVLEKLIEFRSNIVDCNVETEASNGLHHHGTRIHISIDLSVSDNQFTAGSEFQELCQTLEKSMGKKRESSQSHSFHGLGEVSELHPSKNFGKITTMGGRKTYFHRNSVLGNGFDKLEIGTAVAFNEEVSPLGTLATCVTLISEDSTFH